MECNKGFFWLLKHFSKGHTNPSASWVFSMLSQVLSAAKSLQAGSSLKCGKWLMCNLLKPTFLDLFRVFHLILDVFVRLVSDFFVSSSFARGSKTTFISVAKARPARWQKLSIIGKLNRYTAVSMLADLFLRWILESKNSWTSGVCESATAIGGVSLW